MRLVEPAKYEEFIMDWLHFFPDILKYGATGLSALLFFFAFLLLHQECKKKDSDPKVLREIRIYMFISVFLAIISSGSSVFSSSKKFGLAEEFSINGIIKMDDGARPVGVTIITGYPPMTPSADGEIIAYKIWRNPDGELPTLTFQASGYYNQPVELSKFEDDIHDHSIDIGEVILKREEE